VTFLQICCPGFSGSFLHEIEVLDDDPENEMNGFPPPPPPSIKDKMIIVYCDIQCLRAFALAKVFLLISYHQNCCFSFFVLSFIKISDQE
jgi:hypothetical protein